MRLSTIERFAGKMFLQILLLREQSGHCRKTKKI